MDKLAKLVQKKGKTLPAHEMGAKLAALGGIKEEADKVMQDNVRGLPHMKKVSVMSPDKEGLELGLDKAKELVGHGEGADEESEEEHLHPGIHEEVAKHLLGEHGGEDEEGESEPEPTVEALDAKIAKLLELKKHMMMTK